MCSWDDDSEGNKDRTFVCPPGPGDHFRLDSRTRTSCAAFTQDCFRFNNTDSDGDSIIKRFGLLCDNHQSRLIMDVVRFLG